MMNPNNKIKLSDWSTNLKKLRDSMYLFGAKSNNNFENEYFKKIHSLLINNNKIALVHNIFVVIFFLCYLIIIVFNNFYFYKESCLIVEIVILGLLLTILLIMPRISKKFGNWDYLKAFSSLMIHVLINVNIIIRLLLICEDKKMFEENGLNWKKNDYLNKVFYLLFILSNISCSYISFNHPATKSILIIFNLIMAIFLNVFYNFLIEIIAITFISLFIVLLGIKIELVTRYLYTEALHNNLNFIFSNKIIENFNVGYCVINQHLRIINQNSYFSKNFSIFTKRSSPQIFVPFNENSMESNLVLNNDRLLNYAIYKNCNSDAVFNFNNEQMYNSSNMVYEEYLSVENLYQNKEDVMLIGNNSNNILIIDSKTKVEQPFTLHLAILNFINNNQQNKIFEENFNFANLQKFKYLKEDKIEGTISNCGLFEIYIRKNIFYENTYELIFINLTDYAKMERKKSEKKFKNLLLAKISHEFKAPIMYIQNTLDNIPDEKWFDSSYRMPTINRYIHNTYKEETFTKIRFFNEILLLLIMDLSEYFNYNNFTSKISNNYSIIDLFSLKDYIQNLSECFMLIYNKKLKIDIVYDDNLEYARYTTDENKLKQILANILSNAIKNTLEGTIKITIQRNKTSIRSRINNRKATHSINFKIALNGDDYESGTLNSYKLPKVRKNEHLNIRNTVKSEMIQPLKNFISIPRDPFEGFSIIIEDTGPGLEQSLIDIINEDDNVEKLLNTIVIDDDYENYKGMGIGLLICKKLCKELGINIECSLLSSEPLIDFISEFNDSINADNNQPILEKKRSEIPIGSQFVLKFFGEIDTSSNIVTISRVSRTNDYRINIHDKMLLKYDSLSSKDVNFIQGTEFRRIENVASIQINGYEIISKPKHNYRFSVDSSNFDTNTLTCPTEFKEATESGLNVLNGLMTNSMTQLRRFSNNGFGVPFKKHRNSLLSTSALKQVSLFSQTGIRRNSFNPPTNIINSGFDQGIENFININHLNDEIKQRRINTYKNIQNINDSKSNYINCIIIEKDCEAEKNSSNSLKYGGLASLPEVAPTEIITKFHNSENNNILNFQRKDQKKKSQTQNNLPIFKEPIIKSAGLRRFSAMPTIKENNFLKYQSIVESESFSITKLDNYNILNKILIIDDSQNNQDAIETLVKRYYSSSTNKKLKKNIPKIIKLNDGIDLVYELYKDIVSNKTNATKIIFCDEMMNYMNGSEAFTIINKIFENKNFKKIPFVICSAFNQEGHFEKMKSLSIEHVYIKPLSYGNVEYLLDNFIK